MITDELPSPNGVAAGAKATFDLDLDRRYRELTFKVSVAAGNKTADEIVEDIWLEVNGQPLRTHTVPELDEIQTLADEDLSIKTSGSVGGGNLVSRVTLYLAEGFRKNVERGLGLGWNMVGVRSFMLKIQLRAGIVSPSLSGYGIWEDQALDVPFAQTNVTKWLRQDLDAVGTPKDFQKVFNVGGDRDRFLQSVHLWPTSTGTERYINEAELTFNNRVIHHRLYEDNQAVLLSKGMNPDLSASPRYDLVLDESDSTLDMRNLRFINQQNLNLTFNAAPNGTLRAMVLETAQP